MDRMVTHNILVTGKKSYIGNSFLEYIGMHQLPVRVETISMRDTSFKNLTYDKYSSIIHVSGIVHQRNAKVSNEEYYQVNVDNTFEIAALAKKAGVKQFVFISTMAVYGEEITCITKDTVPHPKSIYGKTKLIAESKLLELEDSNFRVVIIRPPMVYGKGCPGNYKLLTRLARNTPIFPEIKNERSMIYIDNLCSFLWEIIRKEQQGIFHPQNQEYVNTSALVQKIANCHGHKIREVRWMNPMIYLLRNRIGIVRKVFGDFTYDYQTLSSVVIDYISFEQSVEETENG